MRTSGFTFDSTTFTLVEPGTKSTANKYVDLTDSLGKEDTLTTLYTKAKSGVRTLTVGLRQNIAYVPTTPVATLPFNSVKVQINIHPNATEAEVLALFARISKFPLDAAALRGNV